MTGFDSSAILAVGLGLALVPVLVIPYVAWSFRRGTVGLGHALLSAGAVIYAMALWTYTIVPLPVAQDLVCTGTTRLQLVPFSFFGDLAGGVTS